MKKLLSILGLATLLATTAQALTPNPMPISTNFRHGALPITKHVGVI